MTQIVSRTQELITEPVPENLQNNILQLLVHNHVCFTHALDCNLDCNLSLKLPAFHVRCHTQNYVAFTVRTMTYRMHTDFLCKT